jgi:hypothetical protein
MIAFIRRHPFLLLAFATILLGVVWHAVGADRTSPGYVVVSVIGFPFIMATRFMSGLVGSGAVAGLLALPLGLAPYLIADWLWQRRASPPPGGAPPRR